MIDIVLSTRLLVTLSSPPFLPPLFLLLLPPSFLPPLFLLLLRSFVENNETDKIFTLRQTGMLKALVVYYELAVKAVEDGGHTWTKLREATNDVWFRLTQVRPLFLPSSSFSFYTRN